MAKRVLRIAVGAAALLVSSVWAQQNVGIGTNTPHPTALLELYSTSKGLLIPRMTQAERDAISSPATGLLIYQTDNTPGFYYWNGTAWIPLLSSSSGSGLFWSLTGNSITGTEFLGTTNAQPLVIRVNNTQTFQFNTDLSLQRDAGGNTRGQGAVDLQSARSAATQVASGDYSVIGGGQNNTASGGLATVGGGVGNTASDWYATVGGGASNTASEFAATVGGGYRNTASDSGATVGGGVGNTASSDGATVGGGEQNDASGGLATVGGGLFNTASGDYATVGGGSQNTAGGQYATVGGGEGNTARGKYPTVGGGQNNTASASGATVGGGFTNTASGKGATVGGGGNNTASGWYATVGGGAGNTASGGLATVGGGSQNTASDSGATVGGGEGNTARGPYATVGGGALNTASGQYATVGGGGENIASDKYATVGGGDINTASGVAATVGGGSGNTASGQYATVGGGYGNTASGDYSAIPGGYNLQVGTRSFGFSGQTSATETDLSANSNIAAFVDVDLWLYSRDRTQASQLRLYEAQAHGSGANYVALRAPTFLSANTTYTLPADLTTTNTVATGILQTDASGNLSWLSPAALVTGSAWALTGNSITSAWNGTSGNFLGTTNAQPLVIATTNTTTPQPIQIWVGNQETFRFNPPGTSAPAWSIQRGGGNQRGLHAVDLQSERTVVTEVASGDYSVIGGGRDNTASGYAATVGGGGGNTASQHYATVGGGWSNTASGGGATVGGGSFNTASGGAATVGGGYLNTVSGNYSTVGGGSFNTASTFYATVGGGRENTASHYYTTVGGGQENTASTFYATVGGGWRNTASGYAATVDGGASNTASGDYATVGGGGGNTASNDYATVGGGWSNTASGESATVGGGWSNTASGDYSAIPGGFYLRVGERSFGFSGQTSATQTDLSANSNIAAFVDVDLWLYSRDFTNASQLRFYEAQAHGSGANYVALRAPTSLSANTTYTLPADLTTTNTVATGILQTDASGNLSWISPTGLAAGTAWALTGNNITSAWDGSSGNFLGTTNAQPLVIATTNTTTPQPIQIWVGNQETFRFNPPGSSAPAWSIQRGGGNQRGLHAVDLQSARSAATQVASGNYSVIGGGLNNTASGIGATVGGGGFNTASGSLYATVGGGLSNTASGGYATVGGGTSNTASSNYTTVGGGSLNTASGDLATVGGGFSNIASGQYATVGGGFSNIASGQYATVGGGYGNTASGDYSAIPGGYNLQVGTRSFGFSGQTSTTQTDLSANSNIAAFVDVDLWLYSRDRTQASQLRFYEAQAHSSGANYVALRAPTSLSANTTYTLPASAPATSAAWLQSDNTGAMSWRPVLYGTVSVDPPNINANTSTTFTVTITGVQTGDLVFLTPPSTLEGALIFQGASVTAANTVTIRMRNVTGAAVDGASLQWSYMVIRP
jgi:hypothetical protein